MNSMENFFNWITKPIPDEDVSVWFNIHNMNYEKIDLCGDIFKTLSHLIIDTYFDEENVETKITLNNEDKEKHFEWCWKQLLEIFKKEKVILKESGPHKDYLKNFFNDTFYNQKEKNIVNAIPKFLDEVFDMDTSFSKSDLDILTELYRLIEKNF